MNNFSKVAAYIKQAKPNSKLISEMSKVRRKYKESFDFAIQRHPDNDYSIKVISHADEGTYVVNLEFDSHDDLKENYPTSFWMKFKNVHLIDKKLTGVIDKLAKYVLR